MSAPNHSPEPEVAPTVEPIVRDPNPGLLRALLHAAYDGIWILASIVSAPWWIARSIVDPAFREMVRDRLTLGPIPGRSDRQRVLIHGVSVGEVKGAGPLVRQLAERHPELEVVISTTTATGLEVARKQYPDCSVVRFPLDFSFVASRFLRRIRPIAVVLIELEIWPNFLRECNRSGIPVAVVNGRITPQSFGQYRLFRRTLPQFNRISLFCVQLEEYAERFRQLGGSPERVLVTGNMKADGLPAGASDDVPEELARLLGGRPGQPVLVAGSTHDPEERMVTEAWSRGAPGTRLVLVPRHPQRAAEIVRDLQALGFPPQLLSALRAGEPADPDRPAIVDTIGELEAVYALAEVVFVGGSLVPHGGQNVLEPAAKGRPVLHGPHVHNFRQEVHLLAQSGASLSVEDTAALAAALEALFADPPRRARMAAAGREAVESSRGATALTLDALQARCLGGAATSGLEAAVSGR